MRQKLSAFIKVLNFESIVWIAGLAFLAAYSPGVDRHFTICPIKNLGFSFCSGCGLGESISHLFRFQFMKSFNAHPLGIFAFIIMLNRIIFLFLKSIHQYQNSTAQIIGGKNNG
ncbi:MAG: DUF2752 domain-containing protein [Ignavibacteriaceae bacterium]|nr:DUF2752 domain-containing protein [Ignavibacteriaceae bacterium]